MELSVGEHTKHRAERPIYQIKHQATSASLSSQLRGLSLESLTLCVWVTLSPLVLYYLTSPSIKLSSLRSFNVSFPYSMFLLLILGAALKKTPPVLRHKRPAVSGELRRNLTLSLILCTLLSLLHVYR